MKEKKYQNTLHEFRVNKKKQKTSLKEQKCLQMNELLFSDSKGKNVLLSFLKNIEKTDTFINNS